MRRTSLAVIVGIVGQLSVCLAAFAQGDGWDPYANPVAIERPGRALEDPFKERLLISYGANLDVILDDVPGRLAVVYTTPDGRRVVRTIGSRVLKGEAVAPKVVLDPKNIQNSAASHQVVANVGFLSFVSADMKQTDVAKYRVDRVATCAIRDADIDWGAVAAREAEFRAAWGANVPADAEFFVVQVASVVEARATIMRESSFNVRASGYGLTADGAYFRQLGDERTRWFVEVTPLYSNPFANPRVRDAIDVAALTQVIRATPSDQYSLLVHSEFQRSMEQAANAIVVRGLVESFDGVAIAEPSRGEGGFVAHRAP